MFRAQKFALFLFGLWMLCGLASHATTQTAAGYIAIGRGHLASQTLPELQAADSSFSSALALDPNNQEANVLKAMTRLAVMFGKPEFQSLLSSLGVIVIDPNPYHYMYQTMEDARGHTMPAAGATSDMVLNYVNTTLMSEIDAAVANLQKVTDTAFRIQLSTAETSLLPTNVDYGDVQIFLSALHGSKAAISLANSQNISVSLPVLYDLVTLGRMNAEVFLETYPMLLTYTGLNQRAASKAAFQSANASYQIGSNFIRKIRNAPAGTDFAFSIDPQDAPREDRFRTRFAGFSAALNGPTLIDGLSVNLVPALTSTTQARSLLPQFKGNYILPNTWPDATMAGAFSSGTQAILNQTAKDENLLYASPVAITVSASPGAGGIAFSHGGVQARSGSSVTVTAFAWYGYRFVNWTEGGTQVSTSADYTFTASADRVLVANFALNPGFNSITASSSPSAGGGSFVFGPTGGYAFGSLQTVGAFPNPGYSFVKWTEVGAPVSTSSYYSFNVTGNRTLVANFTLNAGFYPITTSALPLVGGYTSGDGAFASGSSVTVMATPKKGYTFVNWTEGGTVVSTSANYTLSVSTGRNLVANFVKTYVVFAASSPSTSSLINGVSSGSVPVPIPMIPPGFGSIVKTGSAVNFTVTPNLGYVVSQWLLDGSLVQSGGTSYALNNVAADRTVAVTFAAVNTYAVTPQQNPYGSITPNTAQMINSGGSVAFTATPNSGYIVNQWLVDGVNQQIRGNSFTLSNVTANHTVQATFKARTVVYNLTSDWSDASNSNGVWSYREGNNVLPHVANWGNLTPAQPAWARAIAPPSNNYIPTWFKATSASGVNIQTGDVIVHTTDPYNGVGNGLGNVTWTSPVNGSIKVMGAVWEVGITSTRSNHWTLSLNGTELTAGDINTSNSSRSNQRNLASGTGGAAALTGITVAAGDVLRLQFNATTPAGITLAGTGDEVGVKLIVTMNPAIVRNFDSDGNADILCQNNAGQIIAWYMDGTGVRTSWGWISTGPLGDWKVVGAGDFNNDGNTDILCQNNAGQITVWYLDGAGVRTSWGWISTGPLGDWRVVGTGDFNNDGNTDILCQNNLGQINVWYMNGAGSRTSWSWISTGPLGDWRVVGTGDYNNDGNTDILCQNSVGQINVWYMNGAGVRTNWAWISTGPLGDWRVR